MALLNIQICVRYITQHSFNIKLQSYSFLFTSGTIACHQRKAWCWLDTTDLGKMKLHLSVSHWINEPFAEYTALAAAELILDNIRTNKEVVNYLLQDILCKAQTKILDFMMSYTPKQEKENGSHVES